jgi:hypothetical protein
MQVPIETHLGNCVGWSRTSDVACLNGAWQCPPIHCRRNARSHRDIWLGTIRSSPLQPRLSTKWFSCVPASENFPWWPAVPRRQRGQRSR